MAQRRFEAALTLSYRLSVILRPDKENRYGDEQNQCIDNGDVDFSASIRGKFSRRTAVEV
ncbi:hypothetical protein ACT691_00685 [Vibrio metschnikovii]